MINIDPTRKKCKRRAKSFTPVVFMIFGEMEPRAQSLDVRLVLIEVGKQ